MGLLKKGNKVWFTESNDKKRKLKYTLQIIEVNGKKIGVNTHLTNKIFYEALLDGQIIDIKKSDILFKEKKIFFSIKKRTNNPGSNLGFAENLERQYKCKLSIFCIWFERGI